MSDRGGGVLDFPQGRMGSRGGRPHSRCSIPRVSHQKPPCAKMRTYLGSGLRSEDRLDPLKYGWRELGDHIEGLEVLDDLFGLGSTEDHSAC